MRRIAQQLTQDECVGILENAYRGFLSVNGDGGYPYSVPMNFVYSDGHLYFHCAKEGHKTDAVRRSDKVCFTVLDNPVREPDNWWYHVKSVICFGKARIIDDDAERDLRLRKLGAKYFPEGYDLDGEMRRNGPRADVIDFTILHVTGKRVKER